ncbi:uncharacterized protein LOC117584980 [Drosophila guanche]|uniref:Lipocalin/cytosolic fatty-acid binding domain-containing protein n=1 Tax=Drosophila guanche TaxID=7266 RepID=A0A3B0K5Q1_DROGU|nr:uncharacterized protein LOC117584980 [Drosophila guanche]XP_034130077.1 uncharacterized protein LOC117584980 [Drosophila guanche]SPP83380.1 Hypothetical predicted protein [Drosophila guanche]
METQAFVVTLFVALCCCGMPQRTEAARMRLPLIPTLPKQLNCRADNIGFPFNLTALSGYWYEAARVPNVDVLECLNVSVPDAIVEDRFALDLKYISTVNGGWQYTEEQVDFPWENATQYGTFQLHYGKIIVTYKLAITDYTTYAFVCGYGNISPIPIFKLFTRQRELNRTTIALIQAAADQYGIGSQIAWEQQSLAKCTASTMQTSLGFVIGFVFLWCRILT